jgi:hypothetical protein
MGVGYILLIVFGAYAAMKFYGTQKQIEKDLSNRGTAPPGVSYYCNLAVTHRPQQVQAFCTAQNGDSTQCGNYAPAFGPEENMPGAKLEVWF